MNTDNDSYFLEVQLDNLLKLEGRDVFNYIKSNIKTATTDELVGRDGRVVISDITGREDKNSFIRFRSFASGNMDLHYFFKGRKQGYHVYPNLPSCR